MLANTQITPAAEPMQLMNLAHAHSEGPAGLELESLHRTHHHHHKSHHEHAAVGKNAHKSHKAGAKGKKAHDAKKAEKDLIIESPWASAYGYPSYGAYDTYSGYGAYPYSGIANFASYGAPSLTNVAGPAFGYANPIVNTAAAPVGANLSVDGVTLAEYPIDGTGWAGAWDTLNAPVVAPTTGIYDPVLASPYAPTVESWGAFGAPVAETYLDVPNYTWLP